MTEEEIDAARENLYGSARPPVEERLGSYPGKKGYFCNTRFFRNKKVRKMRRTRPRKLYHEDDNKF